MARYVPGVVPTSRLNHLVNEAWEENPQRKGIRRGRAVPPKSRSWLSRSGVREVAMRRHAGRRLEGACEVEGTQTGLVRERLDGQVLAQIGLDEIPHPLETSGIEGAAGNRQG